ncbi:hypothetical protein SLEP1_g58910 [Rubroshorea leprosula]|uniref:Uncharacterized protein n=1 Tax=Rubroshorea leprosula TaxID=152421 RepID=A0AAV5MQV9_9ROSI|nr:hypothetical protein SLEP1_g58910 [Rubroshorea leprosula]
MSFNLLLLRWKRNLTGLESSSHEDSTKATQSGNSLSCEPGRKPISGVSSLTLQAGEQGTRSRISYFPSEVKKTGRLVEIPSAPVRSEIKPFSQPAFSINLGAKPKLEPAMRI